MSALVRVGFHDARDRPPSVLTDYGDANALFLRVVVASEERDPSTDVYISAAALLDRRAQRIRDIVAQQWAVAIALLTLTSCRVWSWGPDRLVPQGDGWCLFFDDDAVDAVAALPSAAEIVGGEP